MHGRGIGEVELVAILLEIRSAVTEDDEDRDSQSKSRCVIVVGTSLNRCMSRVSIDNLYGGT
jgi:hypothetical protein